MVDNAQTTGIGMSFYDQLPGIGPILIDTKIGATL